MLSALPSNPSTLELLTYIHGKLEALRQEIEEADASGASTELEQRCTEVRLLGEIAHRLWPQDAEKEDPDYTLIMRKKADVANLFQALKGRATP